MGLLLALGAGWRVGCSAPQNLRLATSGLVWLGLLVAVSLWQVQWKFRERLVRVHEESDAIANLYRSLEGLPNSQRTQMRLLLITYLDAKLRLLKPLSPEDLKHCQEETVGLQHQFVHLIHNMRKQKLVSDAEGIALAEQVSHVISSHFRTRYASGEGFPSALWALLMLQAGVVLFLVGRERRGWEAGAAAVLVITTLWCVADYDGATRGLIRLDTSNLKDLVEILHNREQM